MVGEERNDDGLCGAHTQIAGTPCRNRAMANGRCKYHGGMSPSGVHHGRFTSGRYSAVLPKRLVEAYQESRTDPELLSFRDELAVVRSRLGDLLARADTGESRKYYQRLWELCKEYEHGSPDNRPFVFQDIKKTVKMGSRDWMTWEEIHRTISTALNVATYERKRLTDMEAMVTAEEAVAIVAAVVTAIKKHVRDPETLMLLQNEIAEVLGERALSRAERGSGRGPTELGRLQGRTIHPPGALAAVLEGRAPIDV